MRVERGRITARVTASGTLSALVTVQVGSQVSGRIQDILVDFNSPVHRGQVLARIDPQIFRAAVEQARANLAASEGNLARNRARAVDARRQYQRALALSEEERLIAQADVDTADANRQAADAEVQAMEGSVAQARAALHQAEVNLGYTTITSTIDGIVISRDVDVGQTVAASLQAPTLFTIAQDLRKMQVDTNVAEADVGKLRPGMTANVTFTYAEKEDALRVPNAALRFRPSTDLASRASRPGPGERTVWPLRGGGPEPVTIRTGLSDGAATEALDGDLREGDLLVTEETGGSGGGLPRAFRRPL